MTIVECGGVKVYGLEDGTYVASWDGQWIDGTWTTVEDAVAGVLAEIAKGGTHGCL